MRKRGEASEGQRNEIGGSKEEVREGKKERGKKKRKEKERWFRFLNSQSTLFTIPYSTQNLNLQFFQALHLKL